MHDSVASSPTQQPSATDARVKTQINGKMPPFSDTKADDAIMFVQRMIVPVQYHGNAYKPVVARSVCVRS